MTRRTAILVHSDELALAEALVGAVATADALGEVRAVEAVGRREPVAAAARRLREVAEVVIGIGAWPFPDLATRHDAARDALGRVPYWAIETWHGLPAFHDALTSALGTALLPHERVLVTAPDAVVRTLPPGHRVVLRDVAAALHERTGSRPTIAVDRSPATGAVTPIAAEAVRTLVEAHGATAVVRCSLVPGDGPDDAVTAVATELGIELRDVALDQGAQVEVLLDAVATVIRRAVVAASTDAGTAEEQP